ncbi:hypothetical protein [Spirosoma pollinicola]|uniref:hypothetical protein n=1 Tax=Spirosoma pollinicola TaxID=2057025 RepID=UPI0012FDAB79|nr:hypothetical protein [Spirosoma pollinicola]
MWHHLPDDYLKPGVNILYPTGPRPGVGWPYRQPHTRSLAGGPTTTQKTGCRLVIPQTGQPSSPFSRGRAVDDHHPTGRVGADWRSANNGGSFCRVFCSSNLLAALAGQQVDRLIQTDLSSELSP